METRLFFADDVINQSNVIGRLKRQTVNSMNPGVMS